jgi:hypothetical protein
MSDDQKPIQRYPSLAPRRDAVIEQLKDAFSSGYLALDEFESRVATAEHAHALADLEATVGDLPAPQAPALATEAEAVRFNMATKRLEGSILQTRKLTLEASMSTVKIDYREERPIEGVQEIAVRLDMSNLVLYLPDDVVVENRVQEDMSTFKEYRNKYYNPKAARTRIKLTGTSRMSTIKIVRKRYWLFSRKA